MPVTENSGLYKAKPDSGGTGTTKTSSSLKDAPASAYRQRTLSDVAYQMLENHEWLWLAALLVMMLVADLIINGQKKLWYDELFTVITASQHGWGNLWAAVPADGNPPLLALTDHVLFRLFGMSAFVVRLPCLLSMMGALVLIQRSVRFIAGPVAGLGAAALMLMQPAWQYAAEARPYALLLFFTLLAVYGWLLAHASPMSRWKPLFAITVGTAGAVLAHNAGAIEIAVPLLLAEAVFSIRTRSLDKQILLAFAAGLLPLALTVPIMARTNRVLLRTVRAPGQEHLTWLSVGLWLQNAALSVWNICDYHVAFFVLVLAIMAIAVRRETSARRFRRAPTGCHFAAEQWALAIGLTLLMPVTLVVFEAAVRYYNCRYGIGTAAGIAILGALAIASLPRVRAFLFPCVVLWCLLVFCWDTVIYCRGILDFSVQPASLAATDSSVPIVVSNGFRYLPIWWYSPEQERQRLVFLTNRDQAETAGSSYLVSETALQLESRHFPLHVQDYQAFVQEHSRFYLYQTQALPEPDMVNAFRNSGFRMTMTANYGGYVYLAERIENALKER